MQYLPFSTDDLNKGYQKSSESHHLITARHSVESIGPYELDMVYPEDCVKAMKELPSRSVD